MSDGKWFTINDRISCLKIHYSKKLVWEAGDRARDKWKDLYGELPRKALRRKTLGQGTHMKAIYPASFVGDIDAIILSLERRGADQLSLGFQDDDAPAP